MRVVCLGTIGNFAALSVDPRQLKKEVCMAETLCGICKTRTATVIENKTDKLCSRCYYSRYMFRLPKSQPFVKNFTMLQIPLIITWESGIAGNRESLAIGKRRQSAILGNRQSQGIVAGMRECVGNHRESGMQGIREYSGNWQSQGITGNPRQSAIMGNWHVGNS